MPQRTGTLQISDLLAIRNQSVVAFGEDAVAATLQRDLEAHNRNVSDMMAELAETTTDRQRRYGSTFDTEMVDVDEYGRGPTQKQVTGDTVGFPLHKVQYAIGWTRDYMLRATPADMAEQQIASRQAHVRRILRDIKRALYTPTNYTFTDYMDSRVDLAVKALVNADSADIPPGPNGEVFDGSTHTHYDGIAAISNAAAAAMVLDVLEHHNGFEIRIAINIADEAAWRALTDFKPYVDSRLRLQDGQPERRLEITRTNNRPIGLIGAAEVWVKPWALAAYPVAYIAGAGAPKPLAMRRLPQAELQGLRIAAQIDTHPLHAQYMEDYFGIGVWNRTAAMVLRTDNATYAAPTIS